MGRVREDKRKRKKNSQKKEDPGARKGRNGSGASKSRLAKAAGAEPSGKMSHER